MAASLVDQEMLGRKVTFQSTGHTKPSMLSAAETATRVFLAGLRSRRSATEVADHLSSELSGMNSAQIRRLLVRPDMRTRLADVITELTQKWLNILDIDARFAQQQRLQCEDFELAVGDGTGVLFVRGHAGKTYLCSADYRVVREVGSSDQMPFHLLQDDLRYILASSEKAPQRLEFTYSRPASSVAMRWLGDGRDFASAKQCADPVSSRNFFACPSESDSASLGTPFSSAPLAKAIAKHPNRRQRRVFRA